MMMIRRTLVALTLLLAAAVAQAQSPIFLLDSEGGVSTLIFRVDPASGALTTVGSLPTSPYGEALGLAAADANTLYVSTDSGAVLRVTVSPFAFVNLGSVLGRLVGLAFARTGELYAVDEDSDELSRIQPAPLAKIVIGTVRVGTPGGPVLDVSGGDIVQAQNGTWYLWTNGTQDLYSLDVATGVARAA